MSTIAITQECPHHWVIAPPEKQQSEGVCKLCGEKRIFRNFLTPNPRGVDRITLDTNVEPLFLHEIAWAADGPSTEAGRERNRQRQERFQQKKQGKG